MLKSINITKQLFITCCVVFILFIVGLAWAASVYSRAYSAVQFNTISGLGQNISVIADLWGGVKNTTTDNGNPARWIRGVWSAGVAWFNKNTHPYATTDVDFANVSAINPLGYKNDEWDLPNVNDVHYFYAQKSHSKAGINPSDYWAGVYSTSAFNVNPNFHTPSMQSRQLKAMEKRWAPINQTLYYTQYNNTGWQSIDYTQ